jgi:formylglycine-generating enzyme required for sulfatase activity
MQGLRQTCSLIGCAATSIALVTCTPSNPVAQTGPALSPPPADLVARPPSPSPVGKTAHIPETTFHMGSEAGEPDEMPVHPAHVAAFDMDLTEVTVSQYAACVRAGACAPAAAAVSWPGITSADEQIARDMCNGSRPDRQDHPANCVDWTMADAYCRWAGARLPTEEEWEYAACGGDCSKFVPSPTLRGAAHWPLTARVALARPGPFGLYDMAGNVWEWTASAYCPYDHPGCGDRRRVVRGGSWSMVDYLFVRLTDRSPSDPATRNTNLGFRCARSSTP